MAEQEKVIIYPLQHNSPLLIHVIFSRLAERLEIKKKSKKRKKKEKAGLH